MRAEPRPGRPAAPGQGQKQGQGQGQGPGLARGQSQDQGRGHGASDACPGAADLHLTFPGTPLSIRRALQSLSADLEDLDPEAQGTVELVLAEVLNNIAEHAYGNEGRGWINLDCTRTPGALSFRIRDEGAPMPDGFPPLGDPPPLPDRADAIPEGGYGWFLIRDLARDVTYRRCDGVNDLSFRLCVEGLKRVD